MQDLIASLKHLKHMIWFDQRSLKKMWEKKKIEAHVDISICFVFHIFLKFEIQNSCRFVIQIKLKQKKMLVGKPKSFVIGLVPVQCTRYNKILNELYGYKIKLPF